MSAPLISSLGLSVALLAPSAQAVQTKTWTESATNLKQGNSDGVAVTARGRLFLAPRLLRLGGERASGGTAHVWSIASDARGNVFLGTGPEGRILKVGPSGAEKLLYTVAEPMVTALAVLSGGDLLAGTAPEGKIYRIHPDGKGEVWCETGERYVWSLAVGREGTVFAGTGEQGIIFEIDRTGKAEPLFDSDEPHITSLLATPDGELLAGGAGRGLVYRIGRKNDVRVLQDDALAEVSALALEADGSIVAALVAPPEAEPRPPEVRIQVPQAAAVGTSPESVADLEDRERPTLEGIIEGLPGTAEPRAGKHGTRGRVIRIAPDGAVNELWHSGTEAPFCLALGPDGRPLFGTGEPARIYRADADGDVELLATLMEGQVTGLVETQAAIVAATSNPAATYRLERDTSETGLFVSRPFDAEASARWGTIRWRPERSGAERVELATRTGGSAEPDSTWSVWSPPLTDPQGSPIPSPDGRFLQWRARLTKGAGGNSRLSDVSVSYVPHNRVPSLESLRLDPAAMAITNSANFRWSAWDPDGDPIAVVVQYRGIGSTDWKTALRVEAPAHGTGVSEYGDEVRWKEGKATWDVTEVPEGTYEVRAVASDQAANPHEGGKESAAEPPLPLIVDRTPPDLETRLLLDGSVEMTATDSLSPIRRLEVVEGDRVLFVARPLDGVCDSWRESFKLSTLEAGPVGVRRLRAMDSAGNSTERQVPTR